MKGEGTKGLHIFHKQFFGGIRNEKNEAQKVKKTKNEKNNGLKFNNLL
jgi:hypothetical protein